MLSWYVLDPTDEASVPEGPFPFEHLAKLAAAGSLSATSMVARAGSDRWVVAGEDPELAGLFLNAPPTEFLTSSSSASLASASTDMPYTLSNAISLGVAAVKSQWVPLLLAGLVTLAIYGVIGAPQWIMQLAGEASRDDVFASLMSLVGSCFGFVANILIGGPIVAGLAICGANAVAGHGNVMDLFIGFKRYKQVVLAGLLVTAICLGVVGVVYLGAFIAAIVVGGVAGAASGTNAAVGAGITAGVVVGLALSLPATALVLVRVYFVPAIVADASLGSIGVMDALRLNWRMTQGLGWSLMALTVIVMLIMLVSIMLLCLPYPLVGLPFMIATYGAVYTMLFRGGATAATTS